MMEPTSFALYADVMNASGAVSRKKSTFRVVFKNTTPEPHAWTLDECKRFEALCTSTSRVQTRFLTAVGQGKGEVERFWKEENLEVASNKQHAFPRLRECLSETNCLPKITFGSALISLSGDLALFEEATGRHTNLLSSFCMSIGDYVIENALENGPFYVNTLTWASSQNLERKDGLAISVFRTHNVLLDERILGSQAKSCQVAMTYLLRKIDNSAYNFLYVLYLCSNNLERKKLKSLPVHLKSELEQQMRALDFIGDNDVSWRSPHPLFVLITPDGSVHNWARNQVFRFMNQVGTPIQEEALVPRPMLRLQELVDGSLDATKQPLQDLLKKYKTSLDSVTSLMLSGNVHLDDDWATHLKHLPSLRVLNVSRRVDVFLTANDLIQFLQQYPNIEHVVALQIPPLNVSHVDGAYLDILLEKDCLHRVVWISEAMFKFPKVWARIFQGENESILKVVEDAHKSFYK
jgi:hypothetical protein